MKTISITSLLLLTGALAHPVQAEIYKTVDEAGNVIYSDQPLKGAKPVELPGITSYSSPKTPAAVFGSSQSQSQTSSARYSNFGISSPVADATLRDNTGRVDVSLSMNPALRRNDIAVFELNGKQAKARGMSHSFTNVDRGTHTLKAWVIDANGRTLTEVASVTFHMKRISALTRPKAP